MATLTPQQNLWMARTTEVANLESRSSVNNVDRGISQQTKVDKIVTTQSPTELLRKVSIWVWWHMPAYYSEEIP